MARTRKTNRDLELVEALNGQVGLHLRYNRQTRQLVLCDGPDGAIETVGPAIQMVGLVDTDGVPVSPARSPKLLSSDTITVTTSSAAVDIHPLAKKITLGPASDVYMAVGMAAVASGRPLVGGGYYEMGVDGDTDLRLIAGGNVDCLVVQEG